MKLFKDQNICPSEKSCLQVYRRDGVNLSGAEWGGPGYSVYSGIGGALLVAQASFSLGLNSRVPVDDVKTYSEIWFRISGGMSRRLKPVFCVEVAIVSNRSLEKELKG